MKRFRARFRSTHKVRRFSATIKGRRAAARVRRKYKLKGRYS